MLNAFTPLPLGRFDEKWNEIPFSRCEKIGRLLNRMSSPPLIDVLIIGLAIAILCTATTQETNSMGLFIGASLASIVMSIIQIKDKREVNRKIVLYNDVMKEGSIVLKDTFRSSNIIDKKSLIDFKMALFVEEFGDLFNELHLSKVLLQYWEKLEENLSGIAMEHRNRYITPRFQRLQSFYHRSYDLIDGDSFLISRDFFSTNISEDASWIKMLIIILSICGVSFLSLYQGIFGGIYGSNDLRGICISHTVISTVASFERLLRPGSLDRESRELCRRYSKLMCDARSILGRYPYPIPARNSSADRHAEIKIDVLS